MVKNCIKSSLKLLNSTIGVGGIAMIVYGLLMIRVWQPDDEGSSSHHLNIPWFFHAFLGVGIGLCAVTCLGYIAACTANVYCLSSYIIIVLLLLVLETLVMAEVFLNPELKKELPQELSDRFDEFKDFVESNDDLWKWFVWLIFLIQGVCILLATILRIHQKHEANGNESDEEEEEEEEDVQTRLPLLGSSSLRHLAARDFI